MIVFLLGLCCLFGLVFNCFSGCTFWLFVFTNSGVLLFFAVTRVLRVSFIVMGCVLVVVCGTLESVVMVCALDLFGHLY